MPRLLVGQSLAWAAAAVSDVVRKVAKNAGLQVGQIDPTTAVHKQFSQGNLTDWAFLKRLAADVGAGIAAFLTIGGRFAGSAVRPETFAVDAFALELLILAGYRSVWTIVPVVVLWANVHASVVLAPVAACAFAIGTAFTQNRFDDRARHAALAGALAVVATLLTPSGIRLWSYAFALAVAPNPAREHLDAWRPLSFGFAGSVTAVLPGLLLLLVLGPVLRRRTCAEALIAALCLGLTLTHARYATFLVVGWAPLLARTLDERTPLGALAQRRPSAPVLALVPLVVYAAWAVPSTLRIPAEPRGAWTAAAAIAREHRLHGNAYATYIWAAYLHWQHLPLRLLIDAHGDPYPRDVWDDHLALEAVRPNWADVLDRRKIDVVIVPSDTALAQVMLLAPAWRTAGMRDGVIAFARR
ncbi:MAG: hypothetical protein ABR508_12685 [Candidatus Baltobacteraceae bacterium]